MKKWYLILMLIIIYNCSNSIKKNRKESINDTIKIENYKNLKIYKFPEDPKIDSVIKNIKNFKIFRKSVEDLFILNPNGLHSFINQGITNCNELLSSELPISINNPQVISRLKVIKTKLLISRYHSSIGENELLSKSIIELNNSYNYFLEMITDMILNENITDELEQKFENNKISF
ncbi:MAG: hypothetical protein P8M03_05335 [Flavobacteriaceae bacterium]|nr:hypothetical protein [Flavobacteriaceae bacterium]